MTKRCGTCREVKPLSDFYIQRSKLDGRQGECISCSRDSRYRRFLKSRYSLTTDEYEFMLEQQDKVCAICTGVETDPRATRLAVDHDHKIGKVRGLLCKSCNRALGAFKDNPDVLDKAVAYLRR